jgi:hypothetical protein
MSEVLTQTVGTSDINWLVYFDSTLWLPLFGSNLVSFIYFVANLWGVVLLWFGVFILETPITNHFHIERCWFFRNAYSPPSRRYPRSFQSWWGMYTSVCGLVFTFLISLTNYLNWINLLESNILLYDEVALSILTLLVALDVDTVKYVYDHRGEWERFVHY